MKTLYGVWCKRARRRGQRGEESYLYGWIRAWDGQGLTFNKYKDTPSPNDGFMTREEAEAAALLIVAKHPYLIGWLEIRLFNASRVPA